ncbi:YjbF family lipoprotein [Amylibacter sp. IMCC11727]|uniref:YjbF family lipoprotein n=1 Tax=Amylibacter sp. IMCC11727 TaxID=3039851 RepID=UPI00244D9CBD|nr:YjbF family lipoprotein [Amylibacter sp. IMCC11727]WGI21019.1 YjbF family lipoprotein [Amylibacter sp. IMCC11727]
MTPLNKLLAGALCLGLAACSSEKETEPGLGKIALTMAQARLKKKDVEQASKAKPTPGVTREQMQALGRPVVFVSVPRFGSGVAAVELAKNGPFRTYMGADQATVTLRSGIVTATRGLFVDLIAQDLSINPDDLFRGNFPKTYSKTQRHLTGESTLITHEYACAIAPAPETQTLDVFGKTHTVRQFTELCRRKGRAFQNDYWVDPSSNVVWKSNQSVSKEVGHVTLQRVVQ